MDSNHPFADAEVISSYSRAQAIEDGVLVDLRGSEEFDRMVAEAGFKYPVACTQTVWAECIDLTEAAKRACNDVNGRLWDILWMLRNAIRRSQSGTEIRFEVLIVRNRLRPTLTKLKALCGPGDDMEPVITILFPEED